MDVLLIWLKHRKTELLIFAMLFLAGAAFYHPIEYDNTMSRYFFLSAVVDYGTLNIDVYQANTIDISKWNGHYYSNKAPGASFLGVPVYWILRNLTPLKEFRPVTWLDMYLVRVMTTTLLFALLGVVMYRLAQFCGAVPRQAFLMVIAYGFGSIALLHATLFSGHQIAASLGFFSFALLVRSSSNDRTIKMEKWGYGFFAGLLAGFAVITDYTAIVIAICLAVYAITSRPNVRLKTGFILGAGVCVIILAAYNTACFGHPFSFSYAYQVNEEFRKGAAQGICGVGLPKIGALIALLFSPSRGVFFIMPVLLLSFWGIAKIIGQEHRKREAVFIVTAAAGSLLFVSGYYFWHGSTTFGPRFLVPVLPFLAFPIAFLRWRPYLFWLLFVPSCFQVGLSVIGVPHVNRLIANPIVELIIPCIGYDCTALNAGMLLGFEWPWSVMIVIVLIGLLGVWAFRESGRYESSKIYEHISMLSITVLVLWVVMILVMLAVIRTDSPATVRFYKSKVLGDSSTFFNNRGITYYEQGQYQLAIKDYNEAISRNPDCINCYLNRGNAYSSLGRYQPAIKDYNEAISRKLDCVDCYLNRGNAYSFLGQYQLAIKDYNKAISLKPDYANAYYNRGFTYLKQDNKEQGCRDAQKACELGDCGLLELAKSKGC
jgi:hypothetical protein